jgi:hypothetical protein
LNISDAIDPGPTDDAKSPEVNNIIVHKLILNLCELQGGVGFVDSGYQVILVAWL